LLALSNRIGNNALNKKALSRPLISDNSSSFDPLLIGNTRHCIEYFLTAIVSVTEVTDCARKSRDLNLF